MHRIRRPELMDQPHLDAPPHAHALRSLNRVNRILGVDRDLCAAVRQLGGTETLSVVDVGTGGGGFLGYVHRHLEGRQDHLLLGVDRSAFALGRARRWHGDVIRCVRADGRHLPLADDSVDVVTCSLFLHHFDEEDVVRILREAVRIARRGVVIGDLWRSRLAFVLTWLTARLISRSYVFHVDGPRSVRAAWREDELAALVARAGMDGAQVQRRFPFRILLRWRKPGGARAIGD